MATGTTEASSTPVEEGRLVLEISEVAELLSSGRTLASMAADAVEGADDGLERGRVDRLVHADAPGDDVGAARLDVGDSGGVGAGRHGVLRVVDHLELDAEVGLDGVDEGGDGAVAATRDRA